MNKFPTGRIDAAEAVSPAAEIDSNILEPSTTLVQQQIDELEQSIKDLQQKVQDEKELAASLCGSLKKAASKITSLDKEKEEWKQKTFKFEEEEGFERIEHEGTNEEVKVVLGQSLCRFSVDSIGEPNRREQQRKASDAASDANFLKRPSFYQESFSEHFFPVRNQIDGEVTSSQQIRKKLSIPARYAASMARRPCGHLSVALVVSIILSFVAFRFGDFKVEVNNAGWWSRGTKISNRAAQELLVSSNREDLFFSDKVKKETGRDVWMELQTAIQPNWQGGDDEDEEKQENDSGTLANVCSGQWYGSTKMVSRGERHMYGMLKTKNADDKNDDKVESILKEDAIYNMCEVEEDTLTALENSDSCYKCPSASNGVDRCISPYSLVLLARQYLANNYTSEFATTAATSIPCDNLRTLWTPSAQSEFTSMLQKCANWALVVSSNNQSAEQKDFGNLDECPFSQFMPTVVDDLFPASYPPTVRYTSSFYATKKSGSILERMYEDAESKKYDGSDGNPLSGVYDTTESDFYDFYSDSIVGRDMSLAVGSAGVTVVAMIIHTKSPFLTLMGLFQIILSFPLAYFVYYFIAGLVFFPFLNFIGIFVVFALGADDVFVAVDKWKNARHELPHGMTEQVAALALPDAAYAMLLTSTTTAAAFFATAICPVGPIVCFAVFCGLLITFDYLMNIFLVFPALCLYDKWILKGSKNKCVNFDWCCQNTASDDSNATDIEASTRPSTPAVTNENIDLTESDIRHNELEAEKQTLIHRFLDAYYNILHKFRWFVLGVVIAATTVCAVFAAQLTLPVSSEVAILPDSNPYQMHRSWSENLLSNVLAKGEGSETLIIWGLTPADTGDHLNPDSWTTLVLDESFDPRSESSQNYLIGFCDRLFETNFASKISSNYVCPMNRFDEWLKEQSKSNAPSDAYLNNCDGALSVPVSYGTFDPCMIAWTKVVNETYVLEEKGEVKVMQIRSLSSVVFDSPFSDLRTDWNAYEDWLENERGTAPVGVNGVYSSSIEYWWFDTNGQMLKTAYGAAAIALVCAAVVVFISSRSFVLTLFAAIYICYVLVAATACLVGLGWELGFLESILFAILIGISCDFVIHFGHAYTMYPGSVDRHYRSQFALTHMGPSILAAAFTTFMAAVVMVFTEITFFQKFAVILFMTIVHSTLASFVVFIALCDCIGPSEPTKTYDRIRAKLSY
mmetsp:Transcript_3888/g.8675  ORF Transcript_3888/g.8675 Transcript_3888/m.8675 type:complete len:1195 (+) Transcript_3888:233-3817(+)|eukprot:CAMPEP_0171357786 /NCGR_PEP_ID=MMETSP0878-20121228/46416_1 /TAXON_ID=67004 /ORGANISM="Thalassiosira weissflogii, Strain CCMP1336" /LENGTH=1194 /DNA_ID=CAMNT_0011863837 /DNA_START=147 /DNA_END=3731 /DNA_ORIENTATION=-